MWCFFLNRDHCLKELMTAKLTTFSGFGACLLFYENFRITCDFERSLVINLRCSDITLLETKVFSAKY